MRSEVYELIKKLSLNNLNTQTAMQCAPLIAGLRASNLMTIDRGYYRQLMQIIKELDRRVRGKYTDKSVYIIDDNNLVHMAHIDIHYGMSVNGVAKLHTEILENTELNNFYRIYPEKFNNKTYGITFRRWLIH